MRRLGLNGGFTLARKFAVTILLASLVTPLASAAEAVRCAILTEMGPEGVATSALPAIEQALLGMPNLEFVERGEIEKLARERQLRSLFGPESGHGRAELGRLLKADVLFLLRGAETPKPHLDLVACETKGGLRLCNESVSLAEGLAATTKSVKELAAGAIAKRGELIRGIVAVPPFVSNDLGYEHDYLKSGYARIVEQMLLEREGVVVVELAEARAIVREGFLGGGDGVERPLPIYLSGEFRHDGEPGLRTARITLRLMRGETSLGTAGRDGLGAEAAANFVREGASKLVDEAFHAAPTPAAPAAEARALADRAAAFERLESWDEAAALIEASLLLKPGQDDLRHRAVVAYGHLAKRYLLAGGERTIDQVHAGKSHYFRGMDHLEIFLHAVGDLRPYRQEGQTDFVAQFLHSKNGWVIWGRPTAEVLDGLADGRKRDQEALVRIARMRARDGRGDEANYMIGAVSGAPPAETYDVLFDTIKALLDVPGTASRVSRFATHGYTPDVLNTPEGRAFLDRVEALPDVEARDAARALKKQLPAFAAKAEKFREELDARLRPTPADEGPQDVTFRPLQLDAVEADGRTRPLGRFGGCFRGGEGTDFFLAGGSLYRMRVKGRLEPIWKASDPMTGINAAAFDGRYVWASTGGPGRAQGLMVIDPRTGKSSEFSAADGLPTKGEGGPLDKFAPKTLTVVPVSPGKACVVGFFGQTYLAMAGFSPEGGKSFQIFHEAREAPDPEDRQQWRKATIRFSPEFVLALAGRVRPDAPSETRILIGRDAANIDAWYHPLVVDPARRTVEVVRDRIDPGGSTAFSVHDGGAYWAWPDPANPGRDGNAKCLWRVGFPDFRRTLVARDVYRGRSDRATVGIFPERSIVAADRLIVAEKPEGPYRPLRGIVPAPCQQSSYQLLSTHHYGLLLKTFSSELYEAEFRDPMGPDGPKSTRRDVPSPPETKEPRR